MPLKIDFEYDHSTGLFEGRLENGARFEIKPSDLGGKLENNLTLYRRAVINLLEHKEEGRYMSKSDTRRELMILSAGKHVQVVGQPKYKKVDSLDELDIDI